MPRVWTILRNSIAKSPLWIWRRYSLAPAFGPAPPPIFLVRGAPPRRCPRGCTRSPSIAIYRPGGRAGDAGAAAACLATLTVQSTARPRWDLGRTPWVQPVTEERRPPQEVRVRTAARSIRRVHELLPTNMIDRQHRWIGGRPPERRLPIEPLAPANSPGQSHTVGKAATPRASQRGASLRTVSGRVEKFPPTP
jgi:hypothetical protein